MHNPVQVTKEHVKVCACHINKIFLTIFLASKYGLYVLHLTMDYFLTFYSPGSMLKKCPGVLLARHGFFVFEPYMTKYHCNSFRPI